VLPSSREMAKTYAWRTLRCGPAGPMTVAELKMAGLGAAIFVPLPIATDDHHQKWPPVMVGSGAGGVTHPGKRDLTRRTFERQSSPRLRSWTRGRGLLEDGGRAPARRRHALRMARRGWRKPVHRGGDARGGTANERGTADERGATRNQRGRRGAHSSNTRMPKISDA